jgi:hypothetical protein
VQVRGGFEVRRLGARWREKGRLRPVWGVFGRVWGGFRIGFVRELVARKGSFGFVCANCSSGGGLAQKKQAVEGALVHEVEAAFVAVEEGKFGRGSEFSEGGVHAGELAAGGLLLHGAFEHFGFEGPGAAEAPVGGCELFDEAVFEIVDGGEALEEDVAEGFEVLGGLVADEDLFGEQAMADGIGGSAGLAFGGDGSGGSGRVGAVGLETFFGDFHDGRGSPSFGIRVAGGCAGVCVS